MPPFTPKDPALADHLAWLGYVQPEGLVVSAPALVDAQAIIDRAQLGDLQRRFAELVTSLHLTESDTADTQPGIENLQRLVTEFLGWPYELLVGVDPSRPPPESLSISLPEFQETLHPSFAVARPPAPIENRKSEIVNSQWLLLVQSHAATVDLDKPIAVSAHNWHASPSKKFERLLRETGVPIGLLTNGTQLRLIYAPPKENSGTITFPVGAMTEVSGRLILGAFQLLLGSWTLFNAPSEARLPALLQRSRDYQASVSEILAEQVLHALYELLRGLAAAETQINGKLLHDLSAKNPKQIYGGCVAVLLRLVFILFAEDRGLLPASGLYVRHYAVRGLFERLRADAERYPDTMDLRCGAWAQLLALFRIIHGGCKHPDLEMPARAGHLFDPDRYPFLEGRATEADPIGALPRVSDGTIHRILEKLCILEGERVSYRTLDVEEIGSVYQTIMGFGVETASGTAIGIKGKRKNGGVPASPVIYLESLLEVAAKDRSKWLKENADTELTGDADKKLKAAASVDDLLVALEKRIDRHATPGPVGKGGLVLQPGDERRRSGSHYTPRSFTEPIVRKTLEPILKRFGEQPKPEQILELKICDIAVGSAAFLVETCRQLADVLVKSWRIHGGRPQLPPDETEELLAMRLIAQRCLYGVDRNPMATDLAKLSLWLATLAKNHPFTFLDHAIRCGDSLVGLTRRQIETFSWKSEFTTGQLWEKKVRDYTAAALRERQVLLGLGDDYGVPALKRARLEKADELLDYVRFIGDAAICAFFSADKDKAREGKRQEFIERLSDTDFSKRPIAEVKALRGGKFPVMPFHWEIEFPEVFDRENPGFDAIVGNPPFMGGRKISTSSGLNYFSYLRFSFLPAGNTCDLVAYFFRRAFNLIRKEGTTGLIATNTIAQGDTREGGLTQIRKEGGQIYLAKARCAWPGQAGVIVSVLHIQKSETPQICFLNGQQVEKITAFLFSAGGDDVPSRLAFNSELYSVGSFIYGRGFLFDDNDEQASSLAVMREILEKHPLLSDRIKPFVGGEEFNEKIDHTTNRFVIFLSDLKFESELEQYGPLEKIVREKVKPVRDALGNNPVNAPLKKRWWTYQAHRPDFYEKIASMKRLLCICRHTHSFAISFVKPGPVFGESVVLFSLSSNNSFSLLQSQGHEVWARFFSSTIGDALRYSPSDCFETFPFPAGFETNEALEVAGREYYEFRAALMVRQNEGLTKTYNRFHDPEESSADIHQLRQLHAQMDAAVLTAYGWTDLLPKCTCEFLLDYEDEESESAEESGGRKKKKPWRYRWPDEVRDEVLARLLILNAERAEEERIAAGAAALTQPKKPRGKKSSAAPAQEDLLPPPQKDLFAG
jgi:hypothetical protein